MDYIELLDYIELSNYIGLYRIIGFYGINRFSLDFFNLLLISSNDKKIRLRALCITQGDDKLFVHHNMFNQYPGLHRGRWKSASQEGFCGARHRQGWESWDGGVYHGGKMTTMINR